MKTLQQLQLIAALFAGLFLHNDVFAENDVGISLFTFFGERSAELSHDDPLILLVTLENQGAAIAQQQNHTNQRLLEGFAATDAYKSLSDEERKALAENYATRDIPTVSIGSASVQIPELIRFAVRDAAGETIDLPIQPLDSNENNTSSINLTLGESRFYQFAASSEAISKLPAGDYYIAAVMDTRNRRDMWQGTAFSKTIKVSVNVNHSDPGWATSNQRAMMINSLLLENREYAQAETHARTWLEHYPDSIDAWAQLGEALAGQGDNNEALVAFKTARDKFRAKYGDNPPELPMEIIDRINEIDGIESNE